MGSNEEKFNIPIAILKWKNEQPKIISRLGCTIIIFVEYTGREIFYKLFNYIDGGNDQGMKIPMTTPVSLRIIPGELKNNFLFIYHQSINLSALY